MTLIEAAALLGVTPDNLRGAIKRGVLTEHVRFLMGYPVTRSLDLPRNAIRVVVDEALRRVG